jgi:hypothetical protein
MDLLLAGSAAEVLLVSLSCPLPLQRNENYERVTITPQAWIQETETLLSDSEVLTLPGGFEPATPKSPA